MRIQAPSPGRSLKSWGMVETPPIYYWGLIGLMWVLYLMFMLIIYVRHPLGGSDFIYYFRGATRILNNIPLYSNLTVSDYVGPMLVIQIVLPLVTLTNRSYEITKLLWFALNTMAMLASLAIISGHLATRRARIVLWGIPLLLIPLFYSLWLGQLTIIIFFFTVAAWSAYKHRKPTLTGVLLAIIVWTKFYPALLIVYFLWKREWKVVISAAIATFVLIIIQIMGQGFEVFISYYTGVLPELVAIGQPQLNHSNNSVLGFAQKMFLPAPQVIPLVNSPLLMIVTRYGLMLLLVGTLFYHTRQSSAATSPQRYDLEFALTLLVALLLGSTLGSHGMLSSLLVLPILMQTTAPYRFTWITRMRLNLLLAMAMCAINIHLFIILGYLKPPSDVTLPGLLLSTPFFGMMGLWGLTRMALIYVSGQKRG